jgi:hypothetical protein
MPATQRGIAAAAADDAGGQQLATVNNEVVVAIADGLLSPLTCVLGYSEVLAEELAGQLTQEQQPILDAILRNYELLRQQFYALTETAV